MAQSLAPLIYVLAFIAMVLAVQGVAGIMFSSRDQAQRTNRRLTMLASGMQPSDVYSALVRRPTTGMFQNIFLARLYDRFALYCRQAGLDGSPMGVLSAVGAASVALWLVSFFLLRSGNFAGLILNAFFALPSSALICCFVVWMWLSRKRVKRMKQLEEQMPLALDVVNRALRAGHPVVSAVRLAGQEMGDPIGSEFGLVVDETTYGFEFREALMNFARRSGSEDAHFFAVSVGIQAETGGNLAEILEGLATVIRSRATLAKRVKALSSEGRASAILLSALPILLISFMMLTNPAYYTTKFSDPIFWPVVGYISVGYLIGIVMIYRIIHFKY
jgi:tight adherence protein B